MSTTHLQSVISAWKSFGHWKHSVNPISLAFDREQTTEPAPVGSEAREKCVSARAGAVDVDQFAMEQIRTLVRQVFLSGWPKATRQIVFSAVDEGTDIAWICDRIAGTLAHQVSSEVCLVRMGVTNSANQTAIPIRQPPELRSLKNQEISNLWRVSSDLFAECREEISTVAGVCRGLERLKSEFEYSVIEAPASAHSQAILLGQLCDGIVLVLRANSTRRVAARKAKEQLIAANAQVLGTILCDRRFPIPESIYRWL